MAVESSEQQANLAALEQRWQQSPPDARRDRAQPRPQQFAPVGIAHNALDRLTPERVGRPLGTSLPAQPAPTWHASRPPAAEPAAATREQTRAAVREARRAFMRAYWTPERRAQQQALWTPERRAEQSAVMSRGWTAYTQEPQYQRYVTLLAEALAAQAQGQAQRWDAL